jgi:hypothetical protein
MPLTIACPSCKRLMVPDALVGQRMKCPACGGIFQTSEPATSPVPPSPSRARPSPELELFRTQPMHRLPRPGTSHRSCALRDEGTVPTEGCGLPTSRFGRAGIGEPIPVV